MTPRASSILGLGALLIGTSIGFGGAPHARATDAAPARKYPEVATEQPAKPVEPRTVVYRPPARGKPRARAGGGVRGASAAATPSVRALVPGHTGLTTKAAPVLLYYAGSALPGESTLIFTLLDEESPGPLLETQLPLPSRRGIERIDLATRGVELQQGVEYEWAISVIDRARGMGGMISGGFIERVPEAVPAASPGDVYALAAAGLWYDAIAAADDAVLRDPGDVDAEALRSSLLSQAGVALE